VSTFSVRVSPESNNMTGEYARICQHKDILVIADTATILSMLTVTIDLGGATDTFFYIAI
jgi:hypothetical protein